MKNLFIGVLSLFTLSFISVAHTQAAENSQSTEISSNELIDLQSAEALDAMDMDGVKPPKHPKHKKVIIVKPPKNKSPKKIILVPGPGHDDIDCYAENQNGMLFKAQGYGKRARIQARAMNECYRNPYSVRCYALGCKR